MHISKEKMDTSLGTVFHDILADEKLLMFNNFNEKNLDNSFREMASSISFTGKNAKKVSVKCGIRDKRVNHGV